MLPDPCQHKHKLSWPPSSPQTQQGRAESWASCGCGAAEQGREAQPPSATCSRARGPGVPGKLMEPGDFPHAGWPAGHLGFGSARAEACLAFSWVISAENG